MRSMSPAPRRLGGLAPTKPVLTALISMLTLVALATGAPADNFSYISSNVDPLPCDYPGSGVNRADGGTTKYWYHNLTSAVYYPLNASVTTTFDSTELGMQLVTGPPYDLKFKDSNYTNFCGFSWHSSASGGTVGLYSCHELKQSGPWWNSCNKAMIRFDTSYMNSSQPYAVREGVACHETGHGVGLRHRSGDCMQPGSNKPSDDLGQHNITHINDNYTEP